MGFPSQTLSLFNRTFDKLLQLHDGVAAVTPSATGVAGVVETDPGVVDLGVGQVVGEMIVDIQALDVGSGDERYLIVLQGADDSAFTTGKIALAALILGDSTLNFGQADSVVGRYHVPFRNDPHRGVAGGTYDQPKRYARTLAVGVAGTIAASSFDYTAFVGLIAH